MPIIAVAVGIAACATSMTTAEAQRRQGREAARRRLERCGLARQQLGVRTLGGPMFTMDRAGNRNYLDDDERDRAIERASNWTR
ncbi:hypothetical protein [Accumulibacter sp.]|uniref:hypothetical protein n=1 Tax=Accumulibacter sp. TaxID=2053492 RepID=UPI001DA446B2|nr:hypothetical protein [Accumulibacter sp.]MCB1893768.1 hypothetical protein [Rhodocyclaceae bacterium]MCP5230205.1 hypothetical protein [Accumulibacter sp.]